MDFKAPIDITAVLTAVKKHKDILKAVDKLDASEVLRHFTPVPGITDSLELGKVEGGSILRQVHRKVHCRKVSGQDCSPTSGSASRCNGDVRRA